MDSPDMIRDRMLQRYSANLICTPDSDLVIGGYPRSANTFSTDMIHLLCKTLEGQRRPIAHHTHSLDNLLLAQAYGVPMVMLIRDPVDAILSFQVFSGRPIAFCLNRYVKYYSGVLDLTSPFVVARFEEVVTDFNATLARINTVIKNPLPLSTDLTGDTAKVRAIARRRAERKHGAKVTERIGVPNEKREALKQALRAGVEQALTDNPEPHRLYREVLERGQ